MTSKSYYSFTKYNLVQKGVLCLSMVNNDKFIVLGWRMVLFVLTSIKKAHTQSPKLPYLQDSTSIVCIRLAAFSVIGILRIKGPTRALVRVL